MTKEQIKLLEKVGEYAFGSMSMIGVTTGYTHPAQALRNQANAIEAKERDQIEFNIFLEELKASLNL